MKKLLIRKTTTLEWERWSDNHKCALACTKFQTEGMPLNGGTSRSFFFIRDIGAFCEDGKEGYLEITICDILGNSPTKEEAEIMMPALREWWSKYPQLTADCLTEMLLPQGRLRLVARPVKKMGFCESIIEAVAGLGKPLGLRHNKWFTQDFKKIEQETFVHSQSGEWVPIQEYWTSVHPLQCDPSVLIEE